MRKEADDKQRRPPGGGDGDGDDEGQDEACGSADVGDDAKDAGDNSPEGGVGYADEKEAEAEEGAVGRVDGGLKEEILADAGGGILQRLGHELMRLMPARRRMRWRRSSRFISR